MVNLRQGTSQWKTAEAVCDQRLRRQPTATPCAAEPTATSLKMKIERWTTAEAVKHPDASAASAAIAVRFLRNSGGGQVASLFPEWGCSSAADGTGVAAALP